jgi:hypothetical protein
MVHVWCFTACLIHVKCSVNFTFLSCGAFHLEASMPLDPRQFRLAYSAFYLYCLVIPWLTDSYCNLSVLWFNLIQYVFTQSSPVLNRPCSGPMLAWEDAKFNVPNTMHSRNLQFNNGSTYIHKYLTQGQCGHGFDCLLEADMKSDAVYFIISPKHKWVF